MYQNTEDEDQQANFRYFLRHGMEPEDGNSYVVIAQELVCRRGMTSNQVQCQQSGSHCSVSRVIMASGRSDNGQ